MKGATAVLQRKCACGKESKDGASCAECGAKEKRVLQRYAYNSAPTNEIAPRKPEVRTSAFAPSLSGIRVSSGFPVLRKLMIGASNDPLEQEADRVADQVLASPAHPAISAAPSCIQSYSGEGSAVVATAPASVDRVLANSGSPLEPALRQDMGQRFCYDFSHVRVHLGGAAEQSAREVQAHAYTVGLNVVFGAGRFAPGTSEGRRLIAHELAHVVQQSGHTLRSSGDDRKADSHAEQLSIGVENTGWKREADRVARSVGAPVLRNNVPLRPSSSVPIQTLARQPDPQPQTKNEDKADLKAMRLAASPERAIRQWKALSLNEQRLVLIRMTGLYGADFAAAFLPYARGERKPNFSTSIETGTPTALVARGFRDAGVVGGVATWVHPSGQEVKLVAKGHDIEDCANSCSEMMDENECMTCCDEKIDPNNPACLKACRNTCESRL